MTADATDRDFDAQDQAEVLDETNLTDDGDDIANFDEIDDVLDVTRADGDADEDEAVDAADYGPGDLDALDTDEDELEEPDDAYEAEAGLAASDEDESQGVRAGFDEDKGAAGDIEGLHGVRDAASVEGGEDDVTDFEARRLGDEDLDELGYSAGQSRSKAR